MPSANWSFPCSPRNPAKVREELRLLAALIPSWRQRQMPWSPRSGAQLEFGRHLRLSGEVERDPPRAPHQGRRPPLWTAGGPAALPGNDDPSTLRFRLQSPALTDDNLRWTARARFGTYKFFGFAATDAQGYAYLTPAGQRLIDSARPGDVLLRQLLKWQYPDNQHRGRRWPEGDFAIRPFIATARLIRELGGLTKREISLFCFTMRRTEDAAATAEAIRLFRARQARTAGRTAKAREVLDVREAIRARYEAEGRRVVVASMDDYADALIRYFRYTGLFSIRGSRIVVANGSEEELDELIYADALTTRGVTTEVRAGEEPGPASAAPEAEATSVHSGRSGQNGHSGQSSQRNGPIQLPLGEPPPLRLAAPVPLFPDYADGEAFYAYYGDADRPRLPWEEPSRLAEVARRLDRELAELRLREAHLRTGRTALAGPEWLSWERALPDQYDALVELVDRQRRRKLHLETAIYAAESRTPERLGEALDFFRAILAREVIDPPTYLEWNVWRVFLALDQAREIVPHLVLDSDLQPLGIAQGNQPDLEVDYGDFVLVVEATLRAGADQRDAETRPVTRHILSVQRRHRARSAGWQAGGAGPPGYEAGLAQGPKPVYGILLAPRIHPDTAADFFVALKYRVIEREQIVAIPLTIRQLVAALRPFTGQVAFSPHHLRRLLELLVEAAQDAATGDEWLAGIDAALRRWLAGLGAPTATLRAPVEAVALPLF